MSVGKMIARHAAPGDIVCLSGDLGSGKTVVAKGIASGLGIDPAEVVSPTFILLRQHQGKMPMYHFDLYRLTGLADIAGLGYEEYLYGQGISVIEWPGRMCSLLPAEHLLVELSVRSSTERLLRFKGKGRRYSRLAKRIYEDTCR